MNLHPVIYGSRPGFGQVHLSGSHLFTENRARDLAYLKLLDADRMLYNFRKAFGQDTRGALPLGGWEAPDGLLRGHSTGHYLSALAFAAAENADPALKEKLDYLVEELRRLQLLSQGDPAAFRTACTPEDAAQDKWSRDPATWGEGFLSAYSPDQFALLEQYTKYNTIWAPYYTLHKILAGFLDAYTLTGNTTALEAAKGIGRWVSARLGATDPEQRRKMWSMYIAGEYGGMNESLARLYEITGEKAFLDTARLFDNENVFPGLSEGLDTIAGLHANQHIPQMIGALMEYRVTGEEKYYRIARNFWDIVTKHYAYVIGGVGRAETFREPDRLANNIEGDRNCETCCAYNLLKLTQELYRYEPDNAEYMDYYERLQLNQVAASQNPKVLEERHHGVTYMLPIGPGARREYSNDYDDFACCHGTGMENHVKYQENIYYRTDEAVYVNLYIPSDYTLRPSGGLHLRGQFPGEVMTLASDYAVTVRLRVPAWCRDSFYVEQGGAFAATTDQYLELDLLPGEEVTIHLPYRLRFEHTPDQMDGACVGAVLYGPLVMVAPDERTQFLPVHLQAKYFTAEWKDGRPVLHYAAGDQKLDLIPMYEAHDMAYHVYFKDQEE